MISGRGLGHTGGTLDKLESVPGLDVSLSTERLRAVIDAHGMVIAGQTGSVCPADKKLYALRDVTGTVKCLPLIASSIMSKKLAEDLHGLVLDVKFGSGAFMASIEEARTLAETMASLGAALNVNTRALLTDMDQPLGYAVGNALEIKEVMTVLEGGGPEDLVNLSVALAGEMLVLGGAISTLEVAEASARAALNNGTARRKFIDTMVAQGASAEALEDPSTLPRAPVLKEVLAPQSGFVQRFKCTEIGLASMRLGGGRTRAGERIDHAVGVMLHKKRGDHVEKGERLFTIHLREGDGQACATALISATTIGAEAPPLAPLIAERM